MRTYSKIFKSAFNKNARIKMNIKKVLSTFSLSSNKYRISANKRSRRILNFETVMCGAY